MSNYASHMSGLGPAFMKIWTWGSSPRSGSRNAWKRIKNVNGASRLSNISNIFGAIQMISCRDWWPETKPGYITMTRRQSNNQWSGAIAAHPAPKYSEWKIHWKSSRIDFLGSRRHPPHWLSSKGPKYQRGALLISAGTFWRKNVPERSTRVSYSCTTMPRLTVHLQPRRKWPTWASSVFITHPSYSSDLAPTTTTCSLDWKKQLKVRHFSSDAEVIAAAETWLEGQLSEFFFEWLAKVRAKG